MAVGSSCPTRDLDRAFEHTTVLLTNIKIIQEILWAYAGVVDESGALLIVTRFIGLAIERFNGTK